MRAPAPSAARRAASRLNAGTSPITATRSPPAALLQASAGIFARLMPLRCARSRRTRCKPSVTSLATVLGACAVATMRPAPQSNSAALVNVLPKSTATMRSMRARGRRRRSFETEIGLEIGDRHLRLRLRRIDAMKSLRLEETLGLLPRLRIGHEDAAQIALDVADPRLLALRAETAAVDPRHAVQRRHEDGIGRALPRGVDELLGGHDRAEEHDLESGLLQREAQHRAADDMGVVADRAEHDDGGSLARATRCIRGGFGRHVRPRLPASSNTGVRPLRRRAAATPTSLRERSSARPRSCPPS